MEKLLSALKNIPEYKTLLGAVEKRSDYGGWGFNMFLNVAFKF